MENFVFHNPTKIIFGRNRITEIGVESANWGKKGLLVYGQKSCKINKSHDLVINSLSKAGVEIIEHGGVQPNPVLGHVREGIKKVKDNNIEIIIALGGGSVIDTAKAIGVGALVEHDVWKFFTGKKSIKKTLPLSVVLTMAGAGSEMNSGMVITNEETKEKFGFGNKLLYPRVSILDPEITFSVPASHTAYGAIDAISHVLEFYLTSSATDTHVQDRIMEGLIENAMLAGNRCLKNPSDYNGRATLMWTSTLALNGLTAAGLGKVGFPMHMIEHSLSALYDIAHGAGLSIIIPAWLKYHITSKADRIAQLGRRVFPHINQENSDDKAARETVLSLEKWFRQVKSPTKLKEIGVDQKEIIHIAANAINLAKVWRLREYNQKTIENILELAI